MKKPNISATYQMTTTGINTPETFNRFFNN